MSEFAPYVKALEASELRERVLREQLAAAQAREAKLRKLDPLDLAIMFHHTYERLAPNMEYDTRKETRIFDHESANGKLMVAVCAELLPKLTGALPTDDSALMERLKIERDSGYAQALRDVREGKLT